MGNLLKNRGWQFAAIGFVLILSCSVYVYGGQRDRKMQPEQMAKILNLAGVESEAIKLNRDDGFDDGLFFETKDGTVIVLGFSRNGFQRGEPFILSTFDGEVRVILSEDGNLSFINENEGIVSADAIDDIIREVGELVGCILIAVDEMVQGIGECGLDFSSLDLTCILDAVENGVGRFVLFILAFEDLHKDDLSRLAHKVLHTRAGRPPRARG